MDKCLCVGKNYLKHALELGDAVPEEPIYFIKPPSCILNAGTDVVTPLKLPQAHVVHHELELVLRIGRAPTGHWTFTHYTFGLDLTLRQLQNDLKKMGQPWEKAKVFQHSAVLGPWRPMPAMKALLDLEFSLEINGKTRQKGRGSEMRWPPDFLLHDLAQWFPLVDADILFTGTPEGVGPLLAGDELVIRSPDWSIGLQCIK